MQFIDSHCHIYLEEFDNDRSQAMQRAVDAGVTKLILPNVDSTTIPRLLQSCDEFPSICKALIGLHPTSVKANFKEELAIVERELFNNKQKYVGIGEIGIDLYWDKTFYKEQVDVFITQLKLADSLQLPVAIHIRNSFDATFEALEQSDIKTFRGVFHCFSGNVEQALRAIELGFMLGIGGVATFKNSGLDEVIAAINLNHIILETDSPYLAPTPYRGKRNEPAYLSLIAQKVAEIKSVSIETVAEITTDNCLKLFGAL